jgi:hypothetical protein
VASATFSAATRVGAEKETVVASISGFIAGTSEVVSEQGLDPQIVSDASFAGGVGATQFAAMSGADPEATAEIVSDAASATFDATSAVVKTEAAKGTVIAAISGFIAGTSDAVDELDLDPQVVSDASYAGGVGATQLATLMGADVEETNLLISEASSATSSTTALSAEDDTVAAAISGFIAGTMEGAAENDLDVAGTAEAASSGAAEGAVAAAIESGADISAAAELAATSAATAAIEAAIVTGIDPAAATEAAASGSSQGATEAAIDSGLSQDVVDAVIDSSASGSSDGAIVAAEIAGVDTSAIVDAAESGSSQGADAATTGGGSTIDVGDPVVTPPDDADEVIITSPEGPPTT